MWHCARLAVILQKWWKVIRYLDNMGKKKSGDQKKKQGGELVDQPVEFSANDSHGVDSEDVVNVEAHSELPREAQLEQELKELNDKYLRLYSEFDNFRRRTTKERIELFKSAGEEVLTAILPILDDFERAIQSMEGTEDVSALKDGIQLVYDKMVKTLDRQGLKAFNARGEKFDADLHEAVTTIPAPSEDLKGRIVDEIEKGYTLNDKVIRYSKVVIGE